MSLRQLAVAAAFLSVAAAGAPQPPLHLVSTIALPGVSGRIDHLAADVDRQRLFVAVLGNVPSAGRIVVVSRDTMTVTASWPVTAAGANYPMALDEACHRLFVACRRPATLLIYDMAPGNRIGSTATVGDAEDLFFDARRRRVYVSDGEGATDVLRADGAALASVARIPTAPGARTSLFFPEQNRLYVAVPARGGQAAETRVFEAGT